MSINNPNFPPADRRVEEAQKELLRIPKTSHIGSNSGAIHASTFQVRHLTDNIVFNTIFVIISVISLWPLHISMIF